MEGHCSTGQSQQWAVVPMEEEEEEEEEEEATFRLTCQLFYFMDTSESLLLRK